MIKKRILSLLFVILLLSSLAVTAFADNNGKYVYDECDLLSSEQLEELNDMFAEISDDFDFDVVAAIVDKFDEESTYEAAVNYYYDNDYRSDGILLFAGTDVGECIILTFGIGDSYFTDDEIDELIDSFIDYYNQDECYYGIVSFAMGSEAQLIDDEYDIEEVTESGEITEPIDVDEPVADTENEGDTATVGSVAAVDVTAISDSTVHVVDFVGVLSDSEVSDLSAKLKEISNKLNFDVVAVIVNNFPQRTVTEAADDFYDYTGYRKDGAMLYISLAERDWAISTAGKGINYFGSEQLSEAESKVIPYLRNNNYYSAIDAFAKYCNSCVNEATSIPVGKYLLIALVAGLIIALIVTGTMRSKLKSVKMQNTASAYTRQGSMNVRESRDLFLYRNVTRSARQSSSSSGGGGGSHTSSSGSSHGGSSGKF